jgi:alginate O-acetyltransferase complex protein AlgI
VVFSSTQFLFGFLPLLVFAYVVCPIWARRYLLIAASLFFYAWGADRFALVVVGSALADWALARLIELDRERGDLRSARLLLIASIVQNLGLLFYFKYSGFFVENVTQAFAELGIGRVRALEIALPIGISFMTFEKISYVVDVSRGDVRARQNPVDVLLFVLLFPRAIAGPIVRLREIQHQLGIPSRRLSLDGFFEGATRFAHGLAKKVIIADSMAPLADAAFGRGDSVTTQEAWIGVIAYTLQIYFDFSGYSDMAIGLARMFGFTLPENFNHPYSAVSVTDFWRRWHMTLSRWFRDYVYIPLGGNRDGVFRTYGNLIAVFIVTGFWHGASWTFVIWGGYHGVLLLVERVTGQRPVGDGPVSLAWARRGVTVLCVAVGWVIFRAPTFPDALHFLHAMVIPTGQGMNRDVAIFFGPRSLLIGLLALSVFFLPRGLVIGQLLTSGRTRAANACSVLEFAVLPVTLLLVLSSQFSPFLYFRF